VESCKFAGDPAFYQIDKFHCYAYGFPSFQERYAQLFGEVKMSVKSVAEGLFIKRREAHEII
jgi:hypothetical protein